jgi:hypothetical protein
MRQFPIHTGLSIATLVMVLAGAQRLVPRIHTVSASQVSALLDLEPARPVAVPVEAPVIPRPRAVLPTSLLDDSNYGLDHFLEALWRTEGHAGVTRVVHYGDSPTTADLITGDVRSLLQKRFGDSGHGFILVAKPWAWYQHKDVELSGSGWQSSAASHFEAKDGMFGLGGVSFTGTAKARSHIVFETGAAGTGSVTTSHSHFEVWYLRQPDGGTMALSADGKALGIIETAGDAKEPGFASFDVPGGASELELHVEQGRVRVFGVTAEKPGPAGVVSADFIHPYPAGGKMIAVVLVREIELALNRYKLRHADKPPTVSAVP